MAAPVSHLERSSQTPAVFYSVQLLRFLAAFAVVLYHAQLTVGALSPKSVTSSFDYPFGLGAAGVHIFFAISGFVMVVTAFGRGQTKFDARSFLSRRLVRIYPIYWICVLAYLGYHSMGSSPYQLSLAEFGGMMLLLPGYSSLVIGPAWTLSFEMYFYLCFALFMLAGLRRGLILMSIFFVASIIAGRVWPDAPVPGEATNMLLLEFVAGAWIGYLALKGKLPTARPLGFVELGAAGFFVTFLIGYHRMPTAISWGIPAVLILTGAVAWEAAGRRIYWVKRLAGLGDSSYVLYLVHILLIDMLVTVPLLTAPQSPTLVVLKIVVISAICCLVAAGIYSKVERPLLRRLKRLVVGRSSFADAPVQELPR